MIKHILNIWRTTSHMKRFISIMIMILACTLIFASCNNDSADSNKDKTTDAVTTNPTKQDSDETSSGCNHNWELLGASRDATCEKEGENVYKCSRCKERKVETIEKLPHSESDWQYEKYPSRTQDGKRYKSCIDCATVLIEETLPKTVNSEGLSYKDNGDGTCTITCIGTCRDTEILIAEKYDGLTVTAIASKCFFKNKSICLLLFWCANLICSL